MRKLLLYFVGEMLIGEDFEKNEFDAFGLHLMEPNAMLGDGIIFILCFIYFFRLNKLNLSQPYLVYWKWFFAIFGITYLSGGLGHFFFHYWQVAGKIPAWFMSLFATFLVERAMVSVYPKPSIRALLNKMANLKFVIALLATSLMIVFMDIEKDVSKGMVVTMINTAIGLGFSFLFLASLYIKRIHPSFRLFHYAFALLLIAAIVQIFKVNPAQNFDRNDVGHLLIIVVIYLFYKQTIEFTKSKNRISN